MKVYFDQSPAGAGKTDNIIKNITGRQCKCLFVTERRKSFAELEIWMRREAARHGTCPIIETIRSDSRDRLGAVSRQVEALPDRHRLHIHVIVIVTHAAMLRSEFSDFEGWEIVVDEVPPFLDFEDKRTFLDSAFFDAHYRLEPLQDGWSMVTAKNAALELTPTDIRGDQSHEHLAVFHRRVLEASREDSQRFVLCNLNDWAAMESREVQWCWASAFSLWELSAFDRITLLGNRFRADIGARISEALNVEEIEWEELPSPKGGQQFQARLVHINYFSEDRVASRHLFESATGQKMLADIGARLAKELNGHEHIWSANDTANPHKLGLYTPKAILARSGLDGNTYLTPKQAGTNLHQKVSRAAMIYSAKASPSQRALLKLLGIEPEAWERSIEHETILQFVTRTSIRDAGNCSPVHLWVFDRAQALYLKSYFDALDYVTAYVSVVEDGPAIPEKGRAGPKPALRSPEEQAKYEGEKRARDAERKRRSRAERRALKNAA